MGETISGREANDRIIKALDYYRKEVVERKIFDKEIPHFKQEVTNVDLKGFFRLYNRIPATEKRLFTPDEIDMCDFYFFVFTPMQGCTIIISSEPVRRITVNTFHINYN